MDWTYDILMFADKDIAKDGFTTIEILVLIPAILFTIKVIFDVKKFYKATTNIVDNSKENIFLKKQIKFDLRYQRSAKKGHSLPGCSFLRKSIPE